MIFGQTLSQGSIDAATHNALRVICEFRSLIEAPPDREIAFTLQQQGVPQAAIDRAFALLQSMNCAQALALPVGQQPITLEPTVVTLAPELPPTPPPPVPSPAALKAVSPVGPILIMSGVLVGLLGLAYFFTRRKKSS